VSDTPNTEQPAPFVAPTSAVPSSQSMPNIADLVKGSKGRKEPRNPGGASASRNLIVGGIVGGLFLVGGGYFAGQAMASGPKTLAAAIQQASTGKLPCGTPSGTTGAAGLITRLCGSTAGGAPTGGAGGGFGGGGGFGRGISGTVTAMSSGSVTVQTRAGSVTVIVPGTVTVDKTVVGQLADVKVGSSVTVSSTTDSSGNRTAQRITVVPTGSLPTGGGGGGLGG
jgi:hypothetical protein